MPHQFPHQDTAESTAPDAPVARAARLHWMLQVSLMLWLVWLALSGLQAVWLGLAISLVAGAAGAWLAPGRPYRWRPLRMLWFCGYFLVESFRGGVDVSRRSLGVRVDVQPCFLSYRITLPPGPPRTLMVSVVSLLPGTLSADLDGDSGELLVHALTAAAGDTLAPLERRVGWLFGLPAPTTQAAPVPFPGGGS